MKVEKICILGGGTAGFSVASMFARYKEIDNKNLDITVVYSSNIGNIGVGESTLFSINDFFHFLGLKDEDWMKQCNATYKTSISFENFYKKDTQFQYPFGMVAFEDSQYATKWFEMKDHFPEIFTPDTFARYLLPWTRLNEENKLTDNNDIPNYNFDNLSAYHFDTHLLAKFLKQYCIDRGVKFIDDVYTHSILNDDGTIEKIVCNENTIESDLFVDCSGFKSLLLEQVMGVEFIDYNHTLINNRVVRTKIPYSDKETQLKNYTNCVALDNGWCWEIPLWDSLSLGYVHSLKFSSEEEILKEFKSHCKQKGVKIDDDDISIINYKTGRHDKGWVKNVVAVGLSYGFLEPLESTGILTLLHNGFRLIEMLSKRDLFYTDIDRNIFNYTVAKEIDNLRGFIEIHYALSQRDDSDYWRYVTNDIDYQSNENINYFSVMEMTVTTRNYVENYSVGNGLAFVLAGMGYSHYSPAFNKLTKPSEELIFRKNRFVEEDKEYKKVLSTYPSTCQFLKQKIYHE